MSSLFKDKSLAVDINIVLAGLMFLKGNEVGANISNHTLVVEIVVSLNTSNVLIYRDVISLEVAADFRLTNLEYKDSMYTMGIDFLIFN